MGLDYRRNKLSVGFVGAAALLLAILVTPQSAVLHAQEDESFTVAPSAADDDAESTWEPTTEAPADDATDSVLELPQVVAVNHEAVAAGSADASDPADANEATTSDGQPQDQADEQPGDPPDDLVDYAAQEAAASAAAHASEPMIVPGAAFAPATTIVTYVPVGANWRAPAWSGIGAARPLTCGPLRPTSPLLTTPRGSRVIMGGWWHRVR